MDFVTLDEDEFTYGSVADVVPGVQRVVAQNPSKFTYRGTGTYIVGDRDVAVIDPGPQLDSHRDALAAALDGRTVRSILVTHCHADHSPLAAWLAAESGAPTYAYGPHAGAVDEWDIGSLPDDFGRAPEPAPDDEDGAAEPKVEESTDTEFVPDAIVRTGDVVFTLPGLEMRALHTPGHTSNHTCFSLSSGDAGRVLFTGDHVMGWSTTVVSPPDGDMGAYMDSLRLVARRDDDLAIPTHGAPITDPSRFVTQLVEHRVERERQVLDAVRRGLTTIPAMVTELYAEVRVELHRPAGASVLGHLVKLVDDGLVIAADSGRPRLDSTFAAA
ncbi:MAG: MBL fold metallo-hydrolase [Ilumatobacter sp.]|uniref:MBL fold metallo-hydrolase n=1 Tax=Ilumatobacter sp. TaxID=1967498 RepID=UPI003C751245